MVFLLNIFIQAVAVGLTAYLLPGVSIASFPTALLIVVVLWVVNVLVRPILLLITLPINILTIGLFTFVVNALMILLVAKIIPGFQIDGFWWALLFSVILSIVSGILFSVLE